MWTVKSNERMVMSDDGQAMIERRDEQLTIKPGLGRRYARWLDCWREEGGGRKSALCRDQSWTYSVSLRSLRPALFQGPIGSNWLQLAQRVRIAA